MAFLLCALRLPADGLLTIKTNPDACRIRVHAWNGATGPPGTILMEGESPLLLPPSLLEAHPRLAIFVTKQGLQFRNKRTIIEAPYPADLLITLEPNTEADLVRICRENIGMTIANSPGGGVLITEIVPKGIADREKLTTGLVITHINEKPIADIRAFNMAMARQKPGDPLVFTARKQNEDTAADRSEPPPAAQEKPADEEFTVAHVIDGDSIMLDDGREISYIGITTPRYEPDTGKIAPGGREAMEENKHLVEGKKVRFEYDIKQRNPNGVTVTYVYVGDVFVNARLVENGFARAEAIAPNVRYRNLFKKLEDEAKQKHLGLWRSP